MNPCIWPQSRNRRLSRLVSISAKSLAETRPQICIGSTLPPQDRMKIYFYDGSSTWVCARRMEQGRMHWPSSEDGHVQLTQTEFAMLVGGIDLADTRKRKWLRQPLTEASVMKDQALHAAEQIIQQLKEALRLERIRKYGSRSEKLSDLQLELLTCEPGVSSEEVAGEVERGPLPDASASAQSDNTRAAKPSSARHKHPGHFLHHGELPRAWRTRPPVLGRCAPRTGRPLHPITGRTHPHGLRRKNNKVAYLRTPRTRQPCRCSEAYNNLYVSSPNFSANSRWRCPTDQAPAVSSHCA